MSIKFLTIGFGYTFLPYSSCYSGTKSPTTVDSLPVH